MKYYQTPAKIFLLWCENFIFLNISLGTLLINTLPFWRRVVDITNYANSNVRYQLIFSTLIEHILKNYDIFWGTL